jgi:GLPGLI family protein
MVKKFIVKDSLPKWKLHNETKTIGNYICYKATTSRRIVNTKGTFYKDVEAWYTPELTVPFGPKGYGGLPGLIIELTEDKITYYATKIDLTYKIKKINKPIKGRIISNKELLEIGEQATENKGW